MSQRNTVIRTLNDVGLAVWFGGSLMGVIGLNGAAEEEGGNLRTARVASNGWARWTPVNAAAIGVHLIGAAGIGVVNRKRMFGQRGVGAASVAKTVVTAAALGATAYARVLGKKIELASSPNQEDVQRAENVPVEVEQAQQQLRVRAVEHPRADRRARGDQRPARRAAASGPAGARGAAEGGGAPRAAARGGVGAGACGLAR